jgi:hypothetical protein
VTKFCKKTARAEPQIRKFGFWLLVSSFRFWFWFLVFLTSGHLCNLRNLWVTFWFLVSGYPSAQSASSVDKMQLVSTTIQNSSTDDADYAGE